MEVEISTSIHCGEAWHEINLQRCMAIEQLAAHAFVLLDQQDVHRQDVAPFVQWLNHSL